MPTLTQRGQAWWIERAIAAGGIQVIYRDYRGSKTIDAATGQDRKSERDTRRGRMVTLTRVIRIRRSDVPDPKVNVDRVTVGKRTYTVMDWAPVGQDYAKLTCTTESVMASERENYRDF